MKSFFQNLITSILANLVVIIITGIVTAVISIGTSVLVVIRQTQGQTVPIHCWIVLSFSLLIGILNLIIGIVCLVKRSKRPAFPAISSDVRYEKFVTELFFKDRENIFCSREVKLVVLCEKLEKITKQFIWTGSGYKSTVLEKSMGNYTLNDSQRKHAPLSYEIIFDSVKRCGDKVAYKTKTEVEDSGHIMQPFLSHMIKGPTDFVEIRVTAPVGLLKNAQFVEYADREAEIPISAPILLEAKNIGNLETFEYSVKFPELLHNYRIEWTF